MRLKALVEIYTMHSFAPRSQEESSGEHHFDPTLGGYGHAAGSLHRDSLDGLEDLDRRDLDEDAGDWVRGLGSAKL